MSMRRLAPTSAQSSATLDKINIIVINLENSIGPIVHATVLYISLNTHSSCGVSKAYLFVAAIKVDAFVSVNVGKFNQARGRGRNVAREFCGGR